MGIESLLGGFAKGFGQARMMKMQREKDKELTGLQKDFLKLQMKEKEAVILDKKRMSDYESLIMQSPKFQKLLGISPGAGEAAEEPYTKDEPTQKGKSFDSVTDQMSMLQLDPMMAQYLKKFTGVDFPSAQDTEIRKQQLGISSGNLEQRKSMDSWRQGMDVKNYNLKLQETHPGVDVPTEGGGTQKLWLPKYSGQSLSIQTKKAMADEPIPLKDQPLWINPVTMERANPGMTPNQAKGAGYKQVTTGQLEKVQKITAVREVLDEVEKMMEELIPKEEAIGRLGGIARSISAEAQITEAGQKLAVLRDYITANRAQVAKALGEVGNLSETEQVAVTKAFGDIADSGPKAWMQFNLLKKTFDKAKNNAFGLTVKKGTKLSKAKALEILKQAGGDRAKAEEIAKSQGYSF